MIAVTEAPLVPEWVHDGFFPQADEEQLAALGKVWKTQGDQAQQHSDDLDRRIRNLLSSYSGDAADAASAHVTKVRKFLNSTGAACHSLAECCAEAAKLVKFAKTSINVVILALQVQSQKLTGSQESNGNVISKVVTIVKLRQLQIAAQAKIKAIHDAVEKRIAALSPEVDIQPALTIPAGTTSPFAPGSPTTLFTKGKVSQVAGDHGIPLTRNDNGTEGSGLPGAPNAGPRDGTNPDGTGTGGPGEDGTTEDGTEPGLDLTDPTSLFDDPGSAVGADNEQGPEPDGEDSEDNTSISDGVLSDEEQSALEDEVDQQIDDGTPTIDFDGQDLTEDASSIDDSEMPDSFPDQGPVPGGSGPNGSMSVDGGDGNDDSGDDEGAAGMATDAGGGSSGARPADSDGGSTAGVTVDVDSDGGADDGGTYRPPPSTDNGSTSSGGSHSYGVDTGSSGGGGTSYAPPSGSNNHTGSGQDYGGGSSGPGAIDTGSGSGSGSGSGGSGSSGPDRAPGTSAAGYVPPAQVPGDLATPGSGGSGAGLAGGTSGLPGPSGGPSSGAPSGLGSGAGAAPPPPPASGGGIVGAPAPPPAAAAPAPAPSLGGSAATTPHPTAPAQPAPPANVTAQAAQSVSQQQPAAPAQAKQVPPGAPAAQPPDRGVREPGAAPHGRPDGIRTGAVMAAMPLGLAGLAPLFQDLRQRVPAPQDLTSALSLLPTQFGPDDVPLAALPPGWGVPYQKVMLPGEADAYLAGQVTTIRGLVHPYEQVSGLTTPGELQQMLGLGFAIANGRGGTELAFDPDTDGIEVMRFAGIPGSDLVIPVSEGTDPGTGSSIRSLVRHHRRPWSGGGVAPGSSEDLIVEEFEVLPELGLPVPHLAEIWRVNADGTSEHLGTHNARTGLWRRSTVSAPPAGTPLPHGPVAVMPDGARFATVVLNDHEHVLVDRTGQAPDFFTDAPDGTHRHVVDSDQISAVVGVATMGRWQGARVLVLQQAGDHVLVDFIGDDPEQAEALGLRQLGQGQWQQTWVPAADVSGARTWERSYPRPGVTPSRPVAPAPSTAGAG